MCGIAGMWSDMPNNHDDLKALATLMANAIQHRGPDDFGAWADERSGIALGHRRLSILDLSPAGHQPMTSSGGRFVMVFNGEIYNHLYMRAELQAVGAAPAWRGYSDTETLLAGFEYWGVEATLTKTVGMFAIALWDMREQRLHLMRDRMGEKPLYYGWQGNAFLFGSELKALRTHPGFRSDIDRGALALYMRYCYVPAPYSIYRGIYKLEPGCLLSLDANALRQSPLGEAPPEPGIKVAGFSLQRWWSLHAVAETGQSTLLDDEQEALGLLESRLRDAICLQSIADVPLGAFLSGGVDSSAIVALMQSEAMSPVRTFTIGFHEQGYDEAGYARAVAQHLGTDHTEFYVSAEQARAVIPILPALYDEPFADSSQIPTYLVCGQAKQHMTVALSGDGGDELFGGYNRYFWSQRVFSKVGWIPRPVRRLLAAGLTALPSQGYDAVYANLGRFLPMRAQVSMFGDKVHKLAERMASVGSTDELYQSLVSTWKAPTQVVQGAVEPDSVLTRRTGLPRLSEAEHRMMYFDAMSYMVDDILVKVDRAAMGVSLETRVPFLDHRVVELAWRIPLHMKIRDGQGKWALRQVLYKFVPKRLIERPKQGFGIPLGDWLRGPMRSWAESLLDPGRLAREGYFYPDAVQKKWREHLSGARNWQYELWNVLMFQAWLEASAG